MISSMKKHPALWIALTIFVILLLAVLWYTRPVAFSDLNGIGDSPIVSFSGAMSIPMVVNGHPYIDTWTIQTEDDWDYMAGLLKESTYRRSLRNLFDPNWQQVIHNGGGSILGIAVLENQDDFSFHLTSENLITLNGVTYRVECPLHAGLFAEMAASMRENGTFQE